MDFNLKQLRLLSGLSQMKLAHESQVSLPTIQNIESGKANPTVEVLEKLLVLFGLNIQISTLPFDANRASALGVPLLTTSPTKRSHSYELINKNNLKLESRKWLPLLAEHHLGEREELALVAFLKAIKEHYSTFYRNEITAPLFDSIIDKYSHDGRVIKLRRIALANVSRYL